ncbi:MAG: hypothetical protein JNL08_11115 [Planctomycetes bacterium]|nr:hypothetical protein [Planctomycetota bacterium]
MGTTEDTRRRAFARDAARRLVDALRTLRQHPHHTVLCRTAVRRCVDAVRAATTQAPLRLQLGCGQAVVDGEPVFEFALHDAGFGALRTAGIGELVLPRGIDGTAVEHLIQALACATWSDDPDHDPAAAVCARVPEVHLRAAVPDQALDDDRPRADWWLLPPALPEERRLEASIERALHANLPARCARQVVADLDDPDAAAPELLEPVCAALLQRADLASVAWLLEQVQNHTGVPAATAATLLAAARAYCDDARLGDLLASAPTDRLLDLLALAIQLGDDVVDRLGRLAEARRHPLVGWLDELLGRR